MNPLVSVLIPTRGRPEGLEKTILSLFKQDRPKYWHADTFEILLRVDYDDKATLDWIEDRQLKSAPSHLRVLVGPRLNGWASCNIFYTELANEARGEYVWIQNDDCIVQGPWFERLAEAPKRAFIQPEHYSLNQSAYHQCADVGFPIIPRNAWLAYNYPEKPLLPDPIDLGLYRLLVRDNGWPVHYLAGVTVAHDRKVDATLVKERL